MPTILKTNENSVINVVDSEENDRTAEFILLTRDSFWNKDYLRIQEIIIQRDFQLSYSEVEIGNNFTSYSDRTDITPMAFDYKQETRYFYELKTDTTGKFTKEWLTILYGKTVYNGNTYQISSASATSNYDANFGAAFSPYINNVSMSTNISGDKYTAIISASYRMHATLGLSLGDLPIGFNFDFGTVSRSFQLQA